MADAVPVEWIVTKNCMSARKRNFFMVEFLWDTIAIQVSHSSCRLRFDIDRLIEGFAREHCDRDRAERRQYDQRGESIDVIFAFVVQVSDKHRRQRFGQS